MNIIIVGAGELGTHLAKMLSIGYHDIVVIDSDAERLEELSENSDVIVVEGTATSFTVLNEANVSKADLFVSVTNFETVNILSATIAKRLGAKKVIARIDNNDYLTPKHKKVFQDLGIDSLIYPEKLAATEVIGLLGHTGSTDFVDFSGGKLSMAAFRLQEDAPVIDKTLFQATTHKEKLEFRAVAISRDGETIIPSGDDQFMVNDLVYVIASQKGASKMLEYSGKQDIEVKNLMIVGGGRVGIRIAYELEKDVNVTVIEQDKNQSIKLAHYLNGSLIINGDGRDTELLIQERVEGMDAFVAVTGSSETNILTCLVAKRMGVQKVIAEVENFDYIKLTENMGIDAVINKKQIAASRIFRHTMSAEVSVVKCLTGTDAEVLEFVARPNSLITRGKLKDIGFPKDAIVGGIVRGETAYIAVGETEVKPFDRVVVFALPSVLSRIGRFFS